MNSQAKISSSAQAKLQVASLLSGFNKHLSEQGSLKLGNATYGSADITKTLKAFVDAHEAATALEAQLQTARQTVQSTGVSARSLSKLLAAYVRAVFGNDPTVLQDFGLAPTRARSVKPKTLVQAAEKAKATRTARHTMGSRQKKDASAKAAASVSSATPPKAG